MAELDDEELADMGCFALRPLDDVDEVDGFEYEEDDGLDDVDEVDGFGYEEDDGLDDVDEVDGFEYEEDDGLDDVDEVDGFEYEEDDGLDDVDEVDGFEYEEDDGLDDVDEVDGFEYEEDDGFDDEEDDGFNNGFSDSGSDDMSDNKMQDRELSPELGRSSFDQDEHVDRTETISFAPAVSQSQPAAATLQKPRYDPVRRFLLELGVQSFHGFPVWRSCRRLDEETLSARQRDYVDVSLDVCERRISADVGEEW
ncbi:unnamed protein product [Zymoseptoria tritici ST99CH_3D1]|nr:unnamed protein product [Zymoseptoria tritici ST99CH_3D1]